MRTLLRIAWSIFSMLVLVAGPASAFDVFLDSNADDDPYTFVNSVLGPETVPIDLVISFDEDDLELNELTVIVHWGFHGGLECFDLIGSIDFIPFEFLPDRGPFTNIYAHRCVSQARSFCESQMLIDADISGLTEPGNYVLARLDYSRWGFAELTCGQRLWPEAVFEASCWFPSCANPNDPRTTMTLESDVTSTPQPALTSWGRMKSLYR